MGREEGGGFRMENTCIPVADSFQYLAKPIQYLKKKKETGKKNEIPSPKEDGTPLQYACLENPMDGGAW